MEDNIKHNEDVFMELEKYNTIIAYSNFSDELLAFEQNTGSIKTYLDLGISEKLEKEVLKYYGIEKLPCMIKFGCKVYLGDNYELELQVADKKEDTYYKNLVSTLISSANIFIFIKGQALSPKCKFTRSLLKTFEEQNLVYKKDFLDFDILSDHVLREKLKAFYSWPTFPQIFIKGKLLGGLDALEKSIQNRSFQKMLI